MVPSKDEATVSNASPVAVKCGGLVDICSVHILCSSISSAWRHILLCSAMAEYLASIFGTEKDKVNCSFYFKIGACRHGDRCSRIHNKPTFSQTIVLLNVYQNPQNSAQTADGSHLGIWKLRVNLRVVTC